VSSYAVSITQIDPQTAPYYTTAMSRRRPRTNSLVTLTTDFGLRDSYVAEMKGVLLTHCPAARIVDVTHQIAPQDILGGSIVLDRSLRAFPPGTVHVAVVDPGVGSDRKLLLIRLNSQLILCPDNGLITWPWRRLGGGVARELIWRPRTHSDTFHGRDILAPAAGLLAAGKVSARKLAGAAITPQLLDVGPAEPKATQATVIHIDHFGNATTSLTVDARHPPTAVLVRNRSLGPVRRTYADVAIGAKLALVGSAGLLEIAVRNGNAARVLRLKVGDTITLKYAPRAMSK